MTSANNAKEREAKAEAETETARKETRPKTMTDVFIYVCGALVVIGGLWLGYLGVFGHLKSQQSLGLWVLYATILFVLTGAFLYFQKLIWQSKEVVAAQKTDPLPTVPQISAADRPWLSVDIVPNGPLTFENNNVNVQTRFVVRNTGRSAATAATINATMIAPKLGGDVYKEVIAKQTEMCSRTAADIMPRTVFPGDGYAADWGFSIGRDEVKKNGIEGTPIIALFIIGCVNYRFSDQPTVYQTGFVREVHVFKRETPGARYGLFLDQNVPASGLVFDVGTFGGDYAH